MAGIDVTDHRAGRSGWAAWAMAAVFLFAVWIRVANPPVPKRSPDETLYQIYARAVATHPLEAPRDLVSLYNGSAKNWIYPIPLRIGYYYSIAAIMSLFRVTAAQAGLALSTGSSILELAAVALFGLRFFGRWPALIAVALQSVSFQELSMARRVWGDGVSGCAAMVFLWLCAEACVRRRAGWWFAALWIWGGYLMLLKETGAIFFGLCVLGMGAWSWSRERSWKKVALIGAGAAGTAVCSFALMASLCGGVPAAIETARHSAQAAPSNVYGTLFQSGPWYSFPLGLWVASPLAAFGCAVAFAALALPGGLLSPAPERRALALGLAGLIVLVITAATLPPALKNLRYISFIVGPWYLMAGLGLSYLAGRLRRALGPAAAVAMGIVVLLSCWSDYARYREQVIERGMPDLDIRQVVTTPFEPGS